MKKKFASLTAILTAAALLGGCTININPQSGSDGGLISNSGEILNAASYNDELISVVEDLRAEIDELRKMITIDMKALEQIEDISEEQAAEIDSYYEEHDLPAGLGDSQVIPRDWSKYTSDTAKAQLTENQAIFYDRLDEVCGKCMNNPSKLKEICNYYLPGVDYSDLKLTFQEACAVKYWFKYNNPQYYFLQQEVGKAKGKDTLYMRAYSFVQNMDNVAETTNEMFDRLDSWIAECSDDETTTLEKIRAINKKICENVIYEPKVAAGSMEAALGKNQTIYSVLMTPETVCTGYAMTFSAMANAMGIDSIVALSDSHAWNSVKFDDGKYYFVDVCWNDTSNGYSEKYIGVGTDFAADTDKLYGGAFHTYSADSAALWAPVCQSGDYVPLSTSPELKLSAPSLKIAGLSDTALKIEWEAVEDAEKYEYCIYNGSDIVTTKTTERKYLYTVFPQGADSLTVKIRSLNGEAEEQTCSDYAEISASPKSLQDSIAPPSNLRSSLYEETGSKIEWDQDESIDGCVLYTYYSDSDFRKPNNAYRAVNSFIAFVDWNPADDNYFMLISYKNTENGEEYSAPVYFKYNAADGVTVISR